MEVGTGHVQLLTCVHSLQMLQAVHAIHEENIIHTDLKPAVSVVTNGTVEFGSLMGPHSILRTSSSWKDRLN